MNKDKLLKKTSLSWTKEDYDLLNIDCPDCVLAGTTEGEAMEPEDIALWVSDQVRTISVIKESYPEKYKEVLNSYKSDLEYFYSLGKISKEDIEDLMNEENFNFGQ